MNTMGPFGLIPNNSKLAWGARAIICYPRWSKRSQEIILDILPDRQGWHDPADDKTKREEFIEDLQPAMAWIREYAKGLRWADRDRNQFATKWFTCDRSPKFYTLVAKLQWTGEYCYIGIGKVLRGQEEPELESEHIQQRKEEEERLKNRKIEDEEREKEYQTLYGRGSDYAKKQAKAKRERKKIYQEFKARSSRIVKPAWEDGTNPLRAGDRFKWHSNQAERDAYVVAHQGQGPNWLWLCCYYMPNGKQTFFLVDIVNPHSSFTVTGRKLLVGDYKVTNFPASRFKMKKWKPLLADFRKSPNHYKYYRDHTK